MKYPQQNSMPSGIQLWLEEQLVDRGIDAAVYSTYILSVLCNDSSDHPIKPKDSGVKILIEELSEKLKGVREKGLFPFNNSPPTTNFEITQPQSSQEKSFSYYTSHHSASPSASKSKDQFNSSPAGISNVWSGKRAFGSSVGKNRTFSEGNNRDNIYNWLEENKENNGYNRDAKDKLRSRSTVKQQTPEKAYRNMAKSLDRKDDFNRKSEISKSRRLYQQSNELMNEDRVQSLWANEKSFDDLTGCDQDLPMDFQQLLESPEATKMSLDFTRCIGAKQPSSFIQCGTNITSSIWSEKAEDSMDCSMIGESNNESLTFNNSAWGMSNNISLTGPEVVQEPSTVDQTNLWKAGEKRVFDSTSWKVVGNNDNKDSLNDFGKWSDVESTRLLLNDADNFFSSIGSNLHSSLTTLNHNKEDSSFTEVIPKVMNSGYTVAKDMLNIEPNVNRNESTTSNAKKEEEDLLTSMKTHFRPIKQETVEVVPSTAAPRFPDGTTFPISNSLDKPDFHRSPGGGLYLDSDVNNKYMEYNDAEDDTPSEFVPKFRVRQNEKFCQTEEAAFPLQKIVEPVLEEELYFPEDEKLVRSMVEEDEVEEEEENTFWGGGTCIKVDGWMATWPASGIWSNEPNVQQIWCGETLWNATGDTSGQPEPKTGDQYTRLRNEWTQEAEELLSDISQHLYLANYTDNNQPPKASLVESAWGQLSHTTLTHGVPLPASYPVMQS